MKIEHDPHRLERLKEREIPEAWPREIIEQSSEHVRDLATDPLIIAVDRRWYKGKKRELAISYVKIESGCKAITIHPITLRQKRNRMRTGRWVLHENN